MCLPCAHDICSTEMPQCSDSCKSKGTVRLMENSMTQLRSVTCHMGSHSVTCYLTQVNTPRLHPSQTGWYSIYRPFKDGGLSKPRPGCKKQLAHSCYSTLTTRLSRQTDNINDDNVTVTQCYLLPNTSEHTPPLPQPVTPARQAGTRFTDHLRMEG